jgi:hypothetical protein
MGRIGTKLGKATCVVGVYMRSGLPQRKDSGLMTAQRRNENVHYFLWGPDGQGGLSQRLKDGLNKSYGKDISIILLQFNVNPQPGWPVMKDVDNYRPSEKSIGAWITIDDEYFSLPDDAAKERFVRDRILDRLETISKRFKARKLDADIDRLIDDVKKIF